MPVAVPVHPCRRFAGLAAVTILMAAATVVGLPAPASASVSSINAARSSAGLEPLAEHGGLDGVAARHSREMADRGDIFHTASIGSVVGSVVPDWTRAGENVGVGDSLSAVNAEFLRSPTHRANIFGDYTLAGVGVFTGADGQVWVTQVFAKAPVASEPATGSAGVAIRAPVPSVAGRRASAPSPRAPSAARHPVGTASGPGVPPPGEREDPGLPATVGIVGAASPAPVLWSKRAPAGYWLAGADGGVFAFGKARFVDTPAGRPLNAPIVDLAPTRNNAGYWLVGADGGVFAFGNARYLDSLASRPLNAPVVELAPTKDDAGYWLASADGGVFAFGDAPFVGSLADRPLNAPIVAVAATRSGAGYWLASADGGVFAFGDAPFVGSLADRPLNAPIVGLSPTPSGRGYHLVAADGGVFAFGDAGFAGAMAGRPLNAPIVDLDPTPTNAGYRLIGADGGVFSFGDAAFAGSISGHPLNAWTPPT